jgi:hypothetical protein
MRTMSKLSISEVNFTYGAILNKFHIHIFTSFEAYLLSHLYGHVIIFDYMVIKKTYFCLGRLDSHVF